MVTVIKTRSVLRREDVVETTFFVGWEDQTLHNCGKIITSVGQAQEIITALYMGTQQMSGLVDAVHEGFLSDERTGSLSKQVLDKLPDLDGSWPEEVQKKWLEALDHVVGALKSDG